MRSEQEHFEELKAAQANGFEEVCNRICRDLPTGWIMTVDLESGYGGARLWDPNGTQQMDSDAPILDAVNRFVEHAVKCEAAKKPKSKCELCGKMFDGAGTICSRERVESELAHIKKESQR